MPQAVAQIEGASPAGQPAYRRTISEDPRQDSAQIKSDSISFCRPLFSVWGRMKAPAVSSISRTGSRLVRLRESTKVLPLIRRGRSQDVTSE